MISDGVVIGVVLGLIFAAVSYYLYSRIGQLERKVGLMENILLDLKVTTEQTLMAATEPPQHPETSAVEYSFTGPFESTDVEQVSEQAPESQKAVEKTSVSVNYEAMTYKELKALAKAKSITGVQHLSKAQVIDAIRRHDSGDSEEEGTSLTELLSAQPSSGAGAILDDSEVDNSLVQ